MRSLLALALLVACNEPKANPPVALVDLSTSLDAARSEFNAHKAEARFLTLLSPT